MWLVFDMGYDYVMYESVSVTGDSVDVIDLQNRSETEAKRFLSERGQYFRPEESGSDSWFRVIPIPIRVHSSSRGQLMEFQVSFSFVFLANVNDRGNLYFLFPLFADGETKVVFQTVKIIELGQSMKVVGLPQPQAIEVDGEEQDGCHVLRKDIELASEGGHFRISGGVMNVTLEITGGINASDSLALKAHDKVLIPSLSSSRSTVDLESVGHIIFMNTDSFYDSCGYFPRDHVQATAQFLSQCIPPESKQISYYWHKNDGKFEDHDGNPVKNIVSDITGQLANQVTTLHIWMIYPVDSFEELSKWIYPVVEKLDDRMGHVKRQVYHVWIAVKAYPKDFPKLGEEERSCCLPRAFSCLRPFADTIRLACFGLGETHKGRVFCEFDEFPVVCPFWPQRTRIYISPANESDRAKMSQVCCDSFLSESEMSDLIFMADLICVANKIIAWENELAIVCLQTDEDCEERRNDESLKMAEGKALAMMEGLRSLRTSEEEGCQSHPFSRLWALSVQRKGNAIVIEPVVNGNFPKLDTLAWMQYAYWPEKDVLTKKATKVLCVLRQAERASSPSKWAIDRMPDIFPGEKMTHESVGDDRGELWAETMKEWPLEKLRQWIFRRKLRVRWMHWYEEVTSYKASDE